MNAQLDVRVDELPESLLDVARAIGMPATLKLVERFGGVRVYVPRPEKITEDHVIARTIGFEGALALARICRNESIEIPRAARARRLARDRAIRRESGALSVRELALKYGLSERAIYGIRCCASGGGKLKSMKEAGARCGSGS